MPNYDYICPKCGNEFEDFKPISKSEHSVCPKCGAKANKTVSLVGFSIHDTLSARKRSDNAARDADLERDMKDKLGIVGIQKLNSTSMQDIHHDAMIQKDMIREQMAFQQEDKAKKTDAKLREWKREALKRTPQRAKEMKERKAKEAYDKRKISL